jgi:peptidoglycan/LPS O-acetylase OafA/YrhL
MRQHALWVVAGCMSLHLLGNLALHALHVDVAQWFTTQLGYSNKFQLSMGFTLRWFGLFALGMVIYECRAGFRPRHALVLTLIFFDLLPQNFWKRKSDVEGWEQFVVICAAAFAVLIATRYRPRVLRLPPLLFLGTISYSFYLLHQNIGYVVMRNLERPDGLALGPNAAILAALAVTTLLATALTYGVEKPAYKAVKSLINKRRPAPR